MRRGAVRCADWSGNVSTGVEMYRLEWNISVGVEMYWIIDGSGNVGIGVEMSQLEWKYIGWSGNISA